LELTYLKAALLGILQGLTEFLPVSSSGHLALSQRLFQLEPDAPGMLLFDVLAHLGTLVAVLVIFRRSVLLYARRLVRETNPRWQRRRYAWRIAGLGIAASIPTAVIGLTLQDTFEAAFDKPRWIGVALLVTGGLLALTMVVPRGRRGWARFAWWQAVLVGIAQAMAIMPGISRSGATICVASYAGLRRRWAGEFSFFIAVPAIAGAALLKLRDTFDLPAETLEQLAWGPILVGSIASFVVGAFALALLMHLVRKGKLYYFAIYCWLVGLAAIFGAFHHAG
jgi:undecaprenyl-diphosphatase